MTTSALTSSTTISSCNQQDRHNQIRSILLINRTDIIRSVAFFQSFQCSVHRTCLCWVTRGTWPARTNRRPATKNNICSKFERGIKIETDKSLSIQLILFLRVPKNSNSKPGLQIRITLLRIRIRIQLYTLMQIRIRIQPLQSDCLQPSVHRIGPPGIHLLSLQASIVSDHRHPRLYLKHLELLNFDFDPQ